MKIRQGFVSNSSSSSFICEICGETEGGYDISLADTQMIECSYGHVICEGHQTKQLVEQAKVKIRAESGEEVVNDIDWKSDYPKEACPICRFDDLTDHNELVYYRKKYGMTKQKTLAEIKRLYRNYDNFLKAIQRG